MKPPVFIDSAAPLPPHLSHHFEHLNANQREAMQKVLAAQDCTMILGKTTVIAALVKILVAQGKTVLLTSYTHSAVDTILLKLKKNADLSDRTPTTVEQLEHQIMSPPRCRHHLPLLARGDLVQNEVEARLVYQVAETLLRSGVSAAQIGLISLYRQQLKLLSHLLAHRPGIEILTADKSQGRDKECIVISMVRSNDSGFVGDLIKDWRRMNVPFTRARAKLIIFGSRKTAPGGAAAQRVFRPRREQGLDFAAAFLTADKLHPSLNACVPPPKHGAGDMESGVAKENNNTLPDRPQKKAEAQGRGG
ncbi:AAA domain-containing protein [Mycena rebaudengoi]|nr:AAA domain-containing protein [Mycena rebaudengoi]